MLTIAGIVAIVVVAATSLLKNVEWSTKAKTLVATVLSVAGGAVTAWLSGAFNGADVTTSIAVVFAGSQLLYKFILEGTGFEQALANVKVLPSKDA